MTINIKDWSHNDQRQYFEGAYVIFEMNGATRAGRIDRVMDGHCVIDHQQRMTEVPLDNIKWDGLLPPRVISSRRSLMFVSPLGARTTRKPATQGNLSVATIGNDGRTTISHGRGALNDAQIQEYVGGPMYAKDVDEAVSMVTLNDCIALTPDTGYIICYHPEGVDDSDKEHRLYNKSVLLFAAPTTTEIVTYIEANFEDL